MLNRTLVNDGCTLLDPLCYPNCPVDGYVVGLQGFMSSFDVLENTDAWMVALEGLFLVYMRGGYMQIPVSGVGTWICHDGEETHVHLDVVMWTPTEQVAMLYAWMFDQASYFDVEKGKVISVRTHDGETDEAEDSLD